MIEIEQMQSAPQPTEVENERGGKNESVSLGKFKDVNALLSAYNSLQAEFTKRCQRLKELESKTAVDKDTPTIPLNPAPEEISDESKEKILKDYLKGVISLKPTAEILDGAGAGLVSPTSKPKNVSAAGKLAKELFNKNNS